MRKLAVISCLLIVPVLFVACNPANSLFGPTPTYQPSAVGPMSTIEALNGTITVLGQSATVAAFTPTFTPTPTVTPTPTQTPSEEKVAELLAKELEEDLLSTVGIRLTEVSFGPKNAPVDQLTELYVSLECAGQSTAFEAFAAVMNAFRNRKTAKNSVPGSTNVMKVLIYKGSEYKMRYEITWDLVVAYINRKITVDELRSKITMIP